MTAREPMGPLVVSKANPRYFAVASDDVNGRAVYLTGSHIWNNFHDGLGAGAECSDVAEVNDHGAYLAFLKDHGHNFIRLWRWEHFRSQAAGGGFHLCMTPQPWARIGAGTAKDGKPKFDLSAFDDAYFERLRERVIAAGNEGIYVGVMLFDGWAMHLSPPPDNVEGHPFHADNNVNGVGVSSILDYQVLPLDTEVREIQEAYIRKVVDTVQDLPNVLYEVANESSGDDVDSISLPDGTSMPIQAGDSTEWQYWVIDVVKQHERQMSYDEHPIGMTMQYPVPEQRKVNEPLYNSAAEWISPGFDEDAFDPGAFTTGRWFVNPPANDGAKIVITDTDHYAPGFGDALWAWKSFLRGHHPILMDFGIIDVAHPLDPSLGVPPYEAFEPARLAMGDTRRFAERINLAGMEPRGELSSTGYALAEPGAEYLVLEPGDTMDPFTVTLEAGTYAVEWFGVDARQTTLADPVEAASEAAHAFKAPSDGPAVLYLITVGRNR
jgi:hypothetical protein